MIKLYKHGWSCLTLLAMIFLAGCWSDQKPGEDPEVGDLDFKKGIYVINRGLTDNSDESGNISFIERGGGDRIIRKIFEDNNESIELGNSLQSMSVHQGFGYIISTNSNRIDVVNLENFKFLGSISGFIKPRYFQAIDDNTAWVTQWGTNGAEGSIAVIDLNSNSILRTIPTRPGPEEMLIRNDAVYVTNSGGFFLDSVVTKIDIETETIEKIIEVGLSPQSIVNDISGSIWVIARGSKTNQEEQDGRLVQLTNDEISRDFKIDFGAGNLAINNARDRLFYTMRGGVFSHPITQSSISLAPFIDFPYTTIAVDPATDNILGSNARNFTIRGEVVIHSASGEELKKHEVGVLPIEFWFQ